VETPPGVGCGNQGGCGAGVSRLPRSPSNAGDAEWTLLAVDVSIVAATARICAAVGGAMLWCTIRVVAGAPPTCVTCSPRKRVDVAVGAFGAASET
jgi:hypothetical protein